MSLLGAAALVVAGCSAAPEPKPAPAPGSSSPSTTAGTSVTVAGAPAALRRVVEKVYAKSDRPVTAKAHLGRWKGEKIAVVVAGDDLALKVTTPLDMVLAEHLLAADDAVAGEVTDTHPRGQS